MNCTHTPTLPVDVLASVSDSVERALGLRHAAGRLADLERGLVRAAPELGVASAAACAELVASEVLTANQLDVLASHLTIGETYFFRDPDSYRVLETELLAPLIQRRREGVPHLRLWSAGCSTGEEAYSLAILLDRLLPDRAKWNITILATDLNPRFLAKGRRGIYRPWSFRNSPPWLLPGYFTRHGTDEFELREDIRRMVTFSALNLAQDTYPSVATNTNAMDVVFCRNVLMYFLPERARQVADRFRLALLDGGWLFVSAAEVSSELFGAFERVSRNGQLLYRKSPTAPADVPVAAATAPKRDDPGVRRPAAAARPRHASPKPTPTVRAGKAETVAPPPGPEALVATARQCADAGDLETALAWVVKAIHADKTVVDHHLLQANILRELGRDHDAVAALKRCLFLDHNHVLAHVLLGNLEQQGGKAQAAERSRQTAARLLERGNEHDVLPASEGMTVGQLRHMLGTVAGARA